MNSSWDGGEAQAAIWSWAGWHGNAPPSASGGKTRQGFVVYDADNPNQKAGYKLPFAKPVNGSLHAVANGVRNAKSRLPQTDGLSAETKQAAESFLDGYMSKIQEKMREADDRALWVARTPLVRVNQDELSQLAKDKHAFDDSIFDESPPFFWRAQASNMNLDAYGTRMMPDTLRNFAQDADNGVSFMAAHDTNTLPLGRSVSGKYYDGRSSTGNRMEADFYTIPGLNLGAVNTDDFIRGVRSGIIHDVSVGFYGGSIRCSVCDSEMMPFLGHLFSRCDHVPGLMYYKQNADGSDSDTKVMASGDIHGAHLAEVSAVYDGATPGAAVVGITRAMTMLTQEGTLSPEKARLVESHYRIKLPNRSMVVPGFTPEAPAVPPNHPGGTGDVMDDERDTAALDTARAQGTQGAMDQVRGWLVEAGLAPTGAWDRNVERVIRETGADLVRLRPLAVDGETYRQDLINDALAEGVRALGNAFSREAYEPVLKGASIEVIKRMRDDWKSVADKELAPGRATVDDAGSGDHGTNGFRPPRAVHAG
jgi:hypothetical protein